MNQTKHGCIFRSRFLNRRLYPQPRPGTLLVTFRTAVQGMIEVTPTHPLMRLNQATARIPHPAPKPQPPAAPLPSTPPAAVGPAAQPPQPPLRIALLSYRSAPLTGGQGIYVAHLSRALTKLGHHVTVISGPPYPNLDPGVELVRLPSLDLHASDNAFKEFRWRFIASPTDFYEWISHNTGQFSEPYTFGQRALAYLKRNKQRFDIVHDNQSLNWGLLRLARLGLPVTATIHHPITKDRDIALSAEPNKGLRLLIKRWHSFLDMQMEVARRLPHIVAVSHATKRDIVAEFGVAADNIAVVHNGIDTDIFQPAAATPRHPARILTTASADVPLKGLSDLIDAFAQVLKTHPDTELRIIGSLRNGPTARRIEDLNLSDKIEFKSGLTEKELAAEYATATVAVCPSLYEGFGFPVAEALASGTPVVTTCGGALPEVVGDAGLIVPVNSPGKIADAIRTLLNDTNQRSELGRIGRTRMIEHFNWHTAAQAYTDIFRTAITDQHTNGHNRHADR